MCQAPVTTGQLSQHRLMRPGDRRGSRRPQKLWVGATLLNWFSSLPRRRLICVPSPLPSVQADL